MLPARRRRKGPAAGRLLAAALTLGLAACQANREEAVAPSATPEVAPAALAANPVAPAFRGLAGWEADDHAAALATFLNSCPWFADQPASLALDYPDSSTGTVADWRRVCADAQRLPAGDGPAARRFFEQRFRPIAMEHADGSRDGSLVIVSRDGTSCVSAADIAPTLQAALDQWDRVQPRLLNQQAKEQRRGAARLRESGAQVSNLAGEQRVVERLRLLELAQRQRRVALDRAADRQREGPQPPDRERGRQRVPRRPLAAAAAGGDRDVLADALHLELEPKHHRLLVDPPACAPLRPMDQ